MADLAPSDADAARAAQITKSFFYLVGDIMGGTDSTPRVDSSTVRSDGLLGPGGNTGQSIGIGSNGEVYVRGTTWNPFGPTTTTDAAPAGGLVITPGLIMLGIAALFILRHR